MRIFNKRLEKNKSKNENENENDNWTKDKTPIKMACYCFKNYINVT